MPAYDDWLMAGDASTEAIRRFEWGSTSLGDRARWPASLVGCARLMLAAPGPAALAWGDDLTIIVNGAWSRWLAGARTLGRSALSERGFPWAVLRAHLSRARDEGELATVDIDTSVARRFRIIPFFGEKGRATGLWIDGETATGPQPEWLPLALDLGGLAIWDWDFATDAMIWSEALHELLGRVPGEIRPDLAAWLTHIHPEDRDGAGVAMRSARNSGSDIDGRFRILRADEAVAQVSARGRVLRDAGGRPCRAIVIIKDVTELSLALGDQRHLERDLLHRVRGLLAAIRSMVQRSGETAESAGELAGHLEDRMNSLVRLQSLLVQGAGGVDFETLVREELRWAAAGEARATLGGDAVTLPPQVAQTLCILLHELTTNAIKFGALDGGEGLVDVSWRRLGDELLLSWHERNVRLGAEPRRRGFGTALLEEMLPHDLGADVKWGFARDGFGCHITIPLHDRRSAEHRRAGAG